MELAAGPQLVNEIQPEPVRLGTLNATVASPLRGFCLYLKESVELQPGSTAQLAGAM